MTMKGFTLVETMVAITILTLAVTGALFTANTALVAASIARDQLTASYLAQESVEYVRWMRDNEYLVAYTSPTHDTTNAWNNFLSSLGTGTINCPTPNPGIPTYFTCAIQATPATATLPNIDERIVSTVSWSFHGIPHSIVIIDHLTPWQ